MISKGFTVFFFFFFMGLCDTLVSWLHKCFFSWCLLFIVIIHIVFTILYNCLQTRIKKKKIGLEASNEISPATLSSWGDQQLGKALA